MRIKISIAKSPDFSTTLKQSTKALAAAINRTLEEGQRAQRQAMAGSFVDRRAGFLNRMVKIAPSDRATAERLVGRIRIVGPEGREEAAYYLARHEGPGGPQRRAGSVGYSSDLATRIGSLWAIPTPAIRPAFRDAVPRKLYLPALHLQASRYEGTTRSGKTSGYAGVHRTASGKQQIKGSDRTFVLFGANGGDPIGVFQRRGKSGFGRKGRSRGRVALYGQGVRDDIRMIWRFRPTITLKPRLRFYETVGGTIQQRIGINYSGMLTSMIAKSR